MNRKFVAFMILVPLLIALVVQGCKKDESSPTAATPAAVPTFTFSVGGVNYAGDAYAAIRTSTTPHYLIIWGVVTPVSGPWVKVQIYVEDTSAIEVNKPQELKTGILFWAFAMVGDTSNIFWSSSGYSTGGTLTVTKWTGKEIAGTFVMSGITHYDPVRTCNVTNGTFRASSIQEVP